MRIVLDTARDNDLDRVTEVRMDVGRLSGVSIDALSYAWTFMAGQQGVTSGAVLTVNEPAGCGDCRHCGFNGGVDSWIRICPRCGAGGLRFSAGEEFMVTGITGE